MFEELVKRKERELRDSNLKEVRNNLDSKEVALKINNYAKKFNFSSSEIKEKIMQDDLVASFFAKDPSKQNFTEKLVAELLKVSTLPQSGKNCVRFDDNGNICPVKSSNVSKSADFHINKTYITQKYTRATGGAQDNQYADVVDFLIKGSKQHYVAAIVDGDYWNKKREELKVFFKDNPRVKIVSMDDILTGGDVFE